MNPVEYKISPLCHHCKKHFVVHCSCELGRCAYPNCGNVTDLRFSPINGNEHCTIHAVEFLEGDRSYLVNHNED